MLLLKEEALPQTKQQQGHTVLSFLGLLMKACGCGNFKIHRNQQQKRPGFLGNVAAAEGLYQEAAWTMMTNLEVGDTQHGGCADLQTGGAA